VFLKFGRGAFYAKEPSLVARIIIGTSDPLADLSDSFVRALTLLTDNGFLPLTGTMLVSRYAVVVVDDRQILTAIDLLRDRNLPASVDG